jgi:hypothetical protein
MATFIDRAFQGETIDLDNNTYERCHFDNCHLRYSGGAPPTLRSVVIDGCHWEIADQAGRVLKFLRACHALNLEPAKHAIEYIRGGSPPAPPLTVH